MFSAKIRIFLPIAAQKRDLVLLIGLFPYFCEKIIDVEDRSILPSLKKILKAIDGVSIEAGRKRRLKMWGKDV